MNCAFHADVQNSAFCIRCGRALCAECTNSVRGSVYCEPCLAEVIEGTGAKTSRAPKEVDMVPTNPGAAFALGMIPGVGAIYNGEFVKAAVHILIFGLLITLGDSVNGGLFPMLAFGFYWYMPFEAYYTAKKRKLRQEGIELDSPIDRLHRQLGIDKDKELYGGAALIVAGALLLLSNFNVLSIDLGRLWPLLIIGAGVWLLKKRREKAPS